MTANHLHIGDRADNGHRIADIAEGYGTGRLGIETLPQVAGELCFVVSQFSQGGRFHG